MTPLMGAVLFGQLDTVNVLLARGANLSGRLWNGDTALRLAEKWNHPLVAQRLREAGAPE